jgi:hypothetical protein
MVIFGFEGDSDDEEEQSALGSKNGATTYFWVPRNGATTHFWVPRNGVTTHF